MGQTVNDLISTIPRTQIYLVWDRVAPMLEKVPEYDAEVSINDTFKALVAGKKQLWVIEDFKGVLITEILGDTCHLFNLAGEDVDRWLGVLLDAVEDWAVTLGCTSMKLYGRKGWERVNRKNGYGYQHFYSVFKKEI